MKNRIYSKWLVYSPVLIIAALLSGCIKVSSVSPADGATDVATNVSIKINFNNTPNPSTVNFRTILVTMSTGTRVAGQISCSGKAAVFTPDKPLFADTTYKVTIKKGIRDKTGSGLSADYSCSFKTATPLTLGILETTPSNGSGGVSLTSTIRVTFTAPVNPATINSSTFTVTKSGGGTITGTISFNSDNTIAEFKPDESISKNTLYTVNLGADIKTVSGIGLSGTQSFSFMSSNPGELDTSFGTNGIVVTDIDPQIGKVCIVPQSDSKILVSATSKGLSNQDHTIIRYEANGLIDNSFGTGGISRVDFGIDDYVYGLDVDPDGKIYTAGVTMNGSQSFPNFSKLNNDGSPDTAFADNGTKLSFIGYQDSMQSIAVQPDGNIVAAGYIKYNQQWVFSLIRLTETGEYDSSFGSDGIVRDSIGKGVAYAVRIQPDGKIVAAGTAGNSNGDLVVIRYNPDGTRDSSFGSAGVARIDCGSDDIAYSLEIQSDGKIVASGISDKSSMWDFIIVRFNSNGTPDASFGDGGIVRRDLGNDDYANAMAIQPDGKIVLAASCWIGSKYFFTLARFNPDGTPDATFGDDGIVFTDIGAGGPTGIAIQPDGKILAGGAVYDGSKYYLKLVRYQP